MECEETEKWIKYPYETFFINRMEIDFDFMEGEKLCRWIGLEALKLLYSN